MKRSQPEKSREERSCFQGIKNAFSKIFSKKKKTGDLITKENPEIYFANQNTESYSKNFYSSLGFKKAEKLNKKVWIDKKAKLKLVSLGKDDINPKNIQKIDYQTQFQSKNPLCTCSKFTRYQNYFQNIKNGYKSTRDFNFNINEKTQIREKDDFSELISSNQNLIKEITKEMCNKIFKGISEQILNQIQVINNITLNQFSQIIDLYIKKNELNDGVGVGVGIEDKIQSFSNENETSNFPINPLKFNYNKQIPTESKENFKYLNITKALFDTSKIEKRIKEYDPQSELLAYKKENNFPSNLHKNSPGLFSFQNSKISSSSKYLRNSKRIIPAS